MNTSVQHLIDNALNGPVEDIHEPVSEYSFLDEDTVKLAHALDYVSDNLDTIGTMEEKIAELSLLHEKLAADPYNKAFSNFVAQNPGIDPTKAKEAFEAANPEFKGTQGNRAGAQQAARNMQSQVQLDPNTNKPVAGQSVVEAKQQARVGNQQHVRTQRAARGYAGQGTTAYNKGMQAGKAQGIGAAGIGDAIKNTWKSGMKGKAALLGGGALTAGLVGNAVFGGQKTASFVGRWLVPEHDEYDVYLNKTASHDIEVLHGLWEELNFLGSHDAHVTTKVASLRNVDAFEYFLEKVASGNFSNSPFAGLADMVDTSKLPNKTEVLQKQNLGYTPIGANETPTPLRAQERQTAIDNMNERRARQQAGSRKARRQAELDARPKNIGKKVNPSSPTKKYQPRKAGDAMVAARGGDEAKAQLRQRLNDPEVQRRLAERRELAETRDRIKAQQATERKAQNANVVGSQNRTVLERGLSGEQSRTEAVAKRNVSEPLRARDQVAQAENRVQRAEGRAQAIENRNIQKGTNLDATKKRKGQTRVEQRRNQLERAQRRAHKVTHTAPPKVRRNYYPGGGAQPKSSGKGLLYGGAALAGLAGLEYLRRKRNDKNKRRAA